MVDAAICDGDYVVIRQAQTAENGDIVAALLDDEATVKTFQRKDGKVWLLPHNEAYEPIDGTNATDPRQGHRRPAPRLRPFRVRSGGAQGRTRCRDPSARGDGRGVTLLAPSPPGLDKLDRRRLRPRRSRLRGVRELLLLAVLYVAYSGTRLVADDALAPARRPGARAARRRAVFLGLDWEHALNRLFVDVDWLGLVGSYWYATAHYVVTAVVLVWLYRRGPATYAPARRALLLATVAGLVLYLLLPMAPPRLTEGYVDVLSLHSADGWWGSEASAPRGLGGFTNQLAAFPSLHAGWALWVALAIRSATTNRAARRSAGPTRP